ncbi:MAG: hypothetical protein IJQ21_00675 [Lachnospiraceae bacterium]|nr:hypothetical protein [Lachnospiraceae bacterium]
MPKGSTDVFREGKNPCFFAWNFLWKCRGRFRKNHANGGAGGAARTGVAGRPADVRLQKRCGAGTPLPVSKGGAFAQSPDALRQVVLGYDLPHFNDCYADSSAFGGSFFLKTVTSALPEETKKLSISNEKKGEKS